VKQTQEYFVTSPKTIKKKGSMLKQVEFKTIGQVRPKVTPRHHEDCCKLKHEIVMDYSYMSTIIITDDKTTTI
jgi:hypothetical protein